MSESTRLLRRLSRGLPGEPFLFPGFPAAAALDLSRVQVAALVSVAE